MARFFKFVPFGTICVVILSTVMISSVEGSPDARRNNVERSPVPSLSALNETILGDINATGQIIKRVGEFASRALWVRKGKFVLPSGTSFTLAPKITVPGFRRKPFKGALNSDIQATWFLYVYCDKLGITSDMHLFPFDRPPFYPFGPIMRPIEGKDGDKKDDKKDDKKEKPGAKPGAKPGGKPGGKPEEMSVNPYPYEPIHYGHDSYKQHNSNTVYTFFPIQKRTGGASNQQQSDPAEATGNARSNVRKPRSVMSMPPPEKHPGGERAILLPTIENMMANFGFEGKGCMLRAICEIHQFPLQQGYDLLGEMIALFFSVSRSPYAESHMPEYLKAEDAGRSGDCSTYRRVCAKSIFKRELEKKNYLDDEEETNEIPSSPYRSKFEDDEL